MDLSDRETVTVYKVYTVYPSFGMTTERRDLFMDEEVAQKHLEDLKEEAIKKRKENIKEWERELEEGDFEEIEGMDVDPEEMRENRIKTAKEEIEILESDDYLEDKEMPLDYFNSGETYPLMTEVEVIK